MRALVGGLLWLTLLPTASRAAAQEPADVLAEHGCTACHTTDGSEGPAPSFQGLFGRTSSVVRDGQTRDVEVDDAYVAQSIRDPGHDVVSGFNAMPQLNVPASAVDALVTALRELPHEEPGYVSIVPLAVGALGFLFMHLFLSFHPVRRRLVDALGPKWFQIVYSTAVLIPFGLLFVGWMVRPYVPLWDLGDGARWVPLVLMPSAFIFLIAGYTTKNPATAGQQESLSAGPQGITTITRHPALLGFALFGISHLFPNGDLAGLLLFGSLAMLAVLGMLHIDRRRARDLGEPWAEFVRQTSILPFAAILRGRCELDVTGLFWRTLAGLAATGAMLALHEWEFGVSPFPYW